MAFPRYEKVDDHTIKIVVEKAKNMDLETLIKNRKIMQEQLDIFIQRVKDIDEVIAQAKSLGITVREGKHVNAPKSEK